MLGDIEMRILWERYSRSWLMDRFRSEYSWTVLSPISVTASDHMSENQMKIHIYRVRSSVIASYEHYIKELTIELYRGRFEEKCLKAFLCWNSNVQSSPFRTFLLQGNTDLLYYRIHVHQDFWFNLYSYKVMNGCIFIYFQSKELYLASSFMCSMYTSVNICNSCLAQEAQFQPFPRYRRTFYFRFNSFWILVQSPRDHPITNVPGATILEYLE